MLGVIDGALSVSDGARRAIDGALNVIYRAQCETDGFWNAIDGALSVMSGADCVRCVGIEDQQRGQHADADGHADLPGEAFIAMRSGRLRRAAIGTRTKLVLHVLVEPGFLTLHGIPLPSRPD